MGDARHLDCLAGLCTASQRSAGIRASLINRLHTLARHSPWEVPSQARRTNEQSMNVTLFGFGCASLYSLPSARARRRVLDAAFDAGIRHYDVAPMYGLGVAEEELGVFARSHPDAVLVATKFGISPSALGAKVARIQRPIRMLLAAFPALQRSARAAAPGPSDGAGSLLYQTSGYGPEDARHSLMGSLRKLGRTHADLFLLHDPRQDDVPSHDLANGLRQLRAEGMIREWGVTGKASVAMSIGREMGQETVLQVPYDAFTTAEFEALKEWPARVIFFGVLSHSLGRLGREMSNPAVCANWSAAIGADLSDPQIQVQFLLADAITRRPGSTVLYSTTRTDRLGIVLQRAMDASQRDEIQTFRRLLADPQQHQQLAMNSEA